jgi:drug/metabolite transporter (DMT)-like permease
MAVPTLITAILLIVVGVVSYVNGTPGDDGKVSPTALIPAFVGGVLAVCGLLAFSDKLRKHAMHGAAVVGLVGALGGFMPLIRQYSKTGEFDPTKPSAVSGILMILLCAVFVGMCVNSFIQAKKARKAKEAAGATAV